MRAKLVTENINFERTGSAKKSIGIGAKGVIDKNINLINRRYWGNYLRWAIKEEMPANIVEYILDTMDADPNQDTNLIGTAIISGHYDIVKLLLDHGAILEKIHMELYMDVCTPEIKELIHSYFGIAEGLGFQRSGNVKSTLTVGIANLMKPFSLEMAAEYFEFASTDLEETFNKSDKEIYLLGIFFNKEFMSGVSPYIIESIGGFRAVDSIIINAEEIYRKETENGHITVSINTGKGQIEAEYLDANESIYFWGDLDAASGFNLHKTKVDWEMDTRI